MSDEQDEVEQPSDERLLGRWLGARVVDAPRPVLRLFLFVIFLVIFAWIGIMLARQWSSQPADAPSAGSDPTTSPADDGLAPVDCVLGDDAWEWTVDTTEETTDRGTRVLGDFTVTNTTSEPARIWWLRSATSGVGEVSVRWQGGGVVAAGESIGGDVSYASLSDGTESWMLPTHVVAVRDLPGCMNVFELVDGVDTDDEMFGYATPLDLPFGPDAG